MFLEVYERKTLMVQTECHQAEFQNIEAATGNERRPTVDRRYYDGTSSCSVKDDRRRRRRPVRLDVYRNKLIQVRRRHTVQHTVRHQRQLEIDSFRHAQPVQYREGVSDVVVATKSKHQTCCSIEYGGAE